MPQYGVLGVKRVNRHQVRPGRTKKEKGDHMLRRVLNGSGGEGKKNGVSQESW